MSALALRAGPLSLKLNLRSAIVALVLSVVLLGVALLSLSTGDFPLTLPQIGEALLRTGDPLAELIVIESRLPRLLTGIGAGVALGVAGAITQMLLRNALAAPDIVGITSGASLGAILSVAVAGGSGWIIAGAVGGGLLAAALVLVLAWRDGLSPLRLILVGIGINLCLLAIGDVLIARIDILDAADLTRWLVGSLNARNWTDVRVVAVGLALVAPALIWAGFILGRMGMSDDVAMGLGLPLSGVRLALIVLAVTLVALAIAVAGPLPFVAFGAGPIARRLIGQGRPGLFAAGLVGAVICVLADLAGRSLMPGYSLPAGIFTALIGAPVLIWLLFVNVRKRAI